MPNKKPQGFTIVELLIVVVVIAILAAIAVVAYNGVQERARVSRVQSDLKNVAQVLNLYSITNSERYPANTTQVQASGIKNAASAGTGNADMILCGDATGYVVFMRVVGTSPVRQFRIGLQTPLEEVIPRISWSSEPLCATTPYSSAWWYNGW